jgi:hypothetical protein
MKITPTLLLPLSLLSAAGFVAWAACCASIDQVTCRVVGTLCNASCTWPNCFMTDVEGEVTGGGVRSVCRPPGSGDPGLTRYLGARCEYECTILCTYHMGFIIVDEEGSEDHAMSSPSCWQK